MEAVDALSGIGSAAASDAESGIETFLGGIYSIGPAADEAGSQVADAMGNARQAVADTASAFGSVDYSAATEGLGGVAGAADDVAKAAPAAANAGSGLSGVLGMLAERHVVHGRGPVHVDVRGPGGHRRGIGCDQRPEQHLGRLRHGTGQAGPGDRLQHQRLREARDQLGQAAQAYTASSDAVASGANVYGRAADAANALAGVSRA